MSSIEEVMASPEYEKAQQEARLLLLKKTLKHEPIRDNELKMLITCRCWKAWGWELLYDCLVRELLLDRTRVIDLVYWAIKMGYEDGKLYGIDEKLLPKRLDEQRDASAETGNDPRVTAGAAGSRDPNRVGQDS
ncbi:MAG: hypothetical protein JXR37_06360 [Kiritimatiellae bacterium]|nr:hypothetical protein [Kiritimatiellia bacterium]